MTKTGAISAGVLTVASVFLLASRAGAAVVGQWDAATLHGAPIEVVVSRDGHLVIRTPSSVYAAPLADAFAAAHAKSIFSTPVLDNLPPGSRLAPDGMLIFDPKSPVDTPVPLVPITPRPLGQPSHAAPPLKNPRARMPDSFPSGTPAGTGGGAPAGSACAIGLKARYQGGRWAKDGWLEKWTIEDARGAIVTLDDVLEIPTRSADCGRAVLRTTKGVTIVDGATRGSRSLPGLVQAFATSDDGRTLALFPSRQGSDLTIESAAGSCSAHQGHAVQRAVVSPDGRWVLAWTPKADISMIDAATCAILWRSVLGADAAPPRIVSARIENDRTITFAVLPSEAPTRPAIVQVAHGQPARCDVFPFSSRRPLATFPKIDFAAAGEVFAHAVGGAAAFQLSSSSLCADSLNVTPRKPLDPIRPSVEVVAQALISGVAISSHGWPVGPSTVAHPVGTALEYMGADDQPVHEGIDVLVDAPYLDAGGQPSAEPTSVVVQPGGAVYSVQSYTVDYQTVVMIDAPGSRRYAYGHIDPDSLGGDMVVGKTVAGDTYLGAVVRWPDCDFHHLHYRVSETPSGGSETIISPLGLVTPRADTTDPSIASIDLVTNVNAQLKPLLFPDSCVTSAADVLVGIWDVADGGRQIGVQSVTTKIAQVPAGTSTLQWTWDFSKLQGVAKFMNATDPTDAIFTTVPYDTRTDYCKEKEFFIRGAAISAVDKANVFDGKNWNLFLGPGSYTATVTVVDFANRTKVTTKDFCVSTPTP
jgi:hypothetical protein